MERWAPEVAVYQQNTKTHLGRGDAQVADDGGLAGTGVGTGDHDRSRCLAVEVRKQDGCKSCAEGVGNERGVLHTGASEAEKREGRTFASGDHNLAAVTLSKARDDTELWEIQVERSKARITKAGVETLAEHNKGEGKENATTQANGGVKKQTRAVPKERRVRRIHDKDVAGSHG
jgi:hypothetical protein